MGICETDHAVYRYGKVEVILKPQKNLCDFLPSKLLLHGSLTCYCLHVFLLAFNVSMNPVTLTQNSTGELC